MKPTSNTNQNEKTVLISVIVAFYNVEQCVNYCMDSILAQDFADYEVICVDDGSTDSTPVLLDAYAGRDSRVRVVHKKNGGLSDARNRGVLESKGEYVTFVDGDDVVSPHYLGSLANALLPDETCIVIGRHTKLSEKAALHGNLQWKQASSASLYDKQGIAQRMLYNDPMISAWAHLAPRELYVDYPFPKGRLYEDTLMFGAHVLAFDSFAVIEEPIYGYVSRSCSITSYKANVPISKAREFREMMLVLDQSVHNAAIREKSALRYHKALEFSRFYRMLSLVTDDRKAASLMQSEARGFVKRNLSSLLSDKNVHLLSKVRFVMLAFLPRLYLALCDFYDWMHDKKASI